MSWAMFHHFIATYCTVTFVHMFVSAKRVSSLDDGGTETLCSMT